MSLDLTIAIIATNEEPIIARAVSSARGLGRVLVVDGGSTDRTVEAARASGAEVIANPWPGYAAQRRFALARVATEWILFLDADEEISAELADELRFLSPVADGYRIRRRNYFLGRVMRHGAWGRDAVLRLARTAKAGMPERPVHEEMAVDGPVSSLAHPIIHHAQNDFATVGAKFALYMPLMAEELVRRRKRIGMIETLARAKLAFFRDYVLRAGFLDGWRGFVLAFWGMSSIIAKYAEARRLIEEQRDHDRRR